ncbi:tRNA-dihydrouridine synthase [Alicyclobacillus sp. ALC3]|uniref:tRNA-dihydrouridine synthase n=1 Tax=Alicyclobacillus sp. ALC3 TaxID=2796143 RepID=UPI002379DB57|nr:tRNA-dihydrouridine synthase [Alicyclobacillus sp. ALC3]WDL97749.1 tRNA-dihydrouridine synthase [Alicyclobacillus sp. ALC3]
MNCDFGVELLGMKFKNPIWLGASDATNKWNINRAIDSGAGAVVLKSVSELRDFQKPGITRFLVHDENGQSRVSDEYTFFSRGGPLQSVDEISEQLPHWIEHAKRMNVRVVGSVNAGTLEGWGDLSFKLQQKGVDALELNFGNPHARHSKNAMGAKISQSTDRAEQIVRIVTQATSLPVIVKLSPHAPDLIALAQAVRKAGAAGVTMMHRFQGLMIDLETQRPALGGYNGIGGTWMTPLSLYWVSQIYAQIGGPVIGGNGVHSWQSAVEFMLAGAHSVQLSSSVMMHGYGRVADILNGLQNYCDKQGVTRLSDLVGKSAQCLREEDTVEFPPRRAALTDASVCLACEVKPCRDSCFFGALSLKGGVPDINEQCNGCGLCAVHCPFNGALTFVE